MMFLLKILGATLGAVLLAYAILTAFGIVLRAFDRSREDK